MKNVKLFNTIDNLLINLAKQRHQMEIRLSRYRLDFDKYRDEIKLHERHNYKLCAKQEALEDLRSILTGEGYFDEEN